MVTRLQVKASQIGKILSNLEKKYDDADEEKMKKSSSGNLGNQPPPNKIVKVVKIQSIPPFNKNKIRKSPSNAEALEKQLETTVEHEISLADELQMENEKTEAKENQ